MIDRDRIMLPLGALVVAFLAVLLLGTVYSAFQPATATQMLPPSTPTPTPAAPGTPTSTAITTSTTAGTVTFDTAQSEAPTTSNEDRPVPTAGASHGKLTLHLLGADPWPLTVSAHGPEVPVGDHTAVTATANPVSLSVDGPLTELCLTTPAKVHFSIDAGKPVTHAHTTCFDFGQRMEKSELDVRVTPA